MKIYNRCYVLILYQDDKIYGNLKSVRANLVEQKSCVYSQHL